jgi:hypothetical protein
MARPKRRRIFARRGESRKKASSTETGRGTSLGGKTVSRQRTGDCQRLKYRALVTFDWGHPHNTYRQQQLVSALLDAGWLLVETTALTIETCDVDEILEGMALLAKGLAKAGTLTALSFSVIGSESFSTSRNYAAKRNHPNAIRLISELPLPAPRPTEA